MLVQIKSLKKNNRFKFNDTIYTVQRKFSDWKRNDDPYLMTTCGQIFYFDELEVKLIENEQQKK